MICKFFKLSITFWAFIIISLILTSEAYSKIYIRVDQFSQEKFPIAVTKFISKSSIRDQLGIDTQIDALLQKDLNFTALFRFISKKAFLEDPEKSSYTKDSIDFANWAVLDTQALLKGWYSLDKNNNLTIEAHLFDVLTQKEIMTKKISSTYENLNLVVHKISNGIIEALTGEGGIFDTRIAFVGNQTGNKELYIMELDGKNVLRITSNKSINLSPDWSRDGKEIVFTSFKGGRGSALYIANLEEKTITSFNALEGTTIGPTFNPVDNLIAMTYSMKYDRGIYIFNPANASLKKITKGYTIDVSPSFSPDGKEIIFSSNKSGSVQIYKKPISSADDEPQRISFEGKRNLDPAWSPKGDKIAFTGMDTDGYFDLFIMNSDGSNIRRLTYDSNNNEHPSWSPDGQYIVFASSRSGTYQLYVTRPTASSDQIQITYSKFDHTMPSWSPRLR